LKATLRIIKVLVLLSLVIGLSLWLIPTKTHAQALKPAELFQSSTQSNISSSETFTYYLPIINEPFFYLTSFFASGPAFAVPALDNRYIYVGSGFGNYCQNTGEVRAFDKTTLTLVWKTTLAGSIGDTTLTLANGQIIFGVGNGVAAVATNDGRLVWRRYLAGCFQESFIRLHQGRIYIGGSSGDIYSLTTVGNIVWHNHLQGTVFAAPAVAGDTLYFVDMSNRLTAVKLSTGQISWQKKLPLSLGERSGIFASPLFHDNSLFIATYSNDVWRVSRKGQIEAQYSSNDRYVASPVVCDGKIVAANLQGRVDWLDVTTLQPHYTITTTERFLFGTPRCVNDIVIVTGYGTPGAPSALYYLQAGQILKRHEFPCCKSALATTAVDASGVYNVLTSLNLSKDYVELSRSKFSP
jgi:outer membrane protein assembly factor BamB